VNGIDYKRPFGVLANLGVFREQIAAFKEMLFAAPPDEAQRKDIDFLLAGGEIFALVVYGQLILENAKTNTK
jgi:acyl-CoA dehydrogenase